MKTGTVQWGAHSELGVARTSSLLLGNRSQVRDNGMEHERIDILHSKLHLSTGAPGGWYKNTVYIHLVSSLFCPAWYYSEPVITKVAFAIYYLANKKYIVYNRWLIVIFILIPDSNLRNSNTNSVTLFQHTTVANSVTLFQHTTVANSVTLWQPKPPCHSCFYSSVLCMVC